MFLCVFRMYFFFFFNDTATTEIYTLSLHDALPIYHFTGSARGAPRRRRGRLHCRSPHAARGQPPCGRGRDEGGMRTLLATIIGLAIVVVAAKSVADDTDLKSALVSANR